MSLHQIFPEYKANSGADVTRLPLSVVFVVVVVVVVEGWLHYGSD